MYSTLVNSAGMGKEISSTLSLNAEEAAVFGRCLIGTAAASSQVGALLADAFEPAAVR